MNTIQPPVLKAQRQKSQIYSNPKCIHINIRIVTDLIVIGAESFNETN